MSRSGNGKALRTAAIELERFHYAQQFGQTFQGRRDLNAIYGHDVVLEPAHYRARYERGGIAKRIVEAFPKSAWRGGGEIVETDDLDTLTPFEKALAALDERLHLWPTFQELDVEVGLGRFAVLIIGHASDSATPLPRGSSPDEILYLKPYGEQAIAIEKWEADKRSPRFDMPLLYAITFATSSGTSTEKFHWTRVIHCAMGRPGGVFGPPRLKAPWNYLDCLEKVVEGVSEATLQRADPGLNLKIDPTIPYDETEETLLREQVEKRRLGLTRDLTTRGVEVEQLSLSVPSMKPNVETLIDLISATSEIPQRIFMGSERGVLASQQDDSNWDERVGDYRDSYCSPVVAEPTINRLVEFGFLPKPAQRFHVKWPDAKEMDEDERIEMAGKFAGVNKDNPQLVYSPDEIRAVTGHSPQSDVPDFDELKKEAEELAADAEDAASDIADDEDDADFARAASFKDVDAPAADEAWRLIHRAADAGAPAVAKVIERGFAMATAGIDRERLLSACEAHSTDRAMGVIEDALGDAELVMRERLAAVLLDVLTAGANAAARTARTDGRFAAKPEEATAELLIEFDAENPAATLWARQRSGSLVVEVGRETREALREIIAAMFAVGVTPRDAARDIRASVGLTVRAEQAVRELERELRAAAPGTLVTRAGGKFRVRVPAKGDIRAFLNGRVAKYRERMHRLRAITIARTEALAAANEGQRQLWLQARDAGLLRVNVKREWITTPDSRICPQCEGMEGQVVGLEEQFTGPSGEQLLGPPLHPSCRCAVGITQEKA